MRGRPRRRAATASGPLGLQGGNMSHRLMLVHPRAGRPLRPALVGTTAMALAAALGLAAATPASAVQLGPLTKVSDGDPFAACTADKVAKQPGTLYPNTEIEPWIASNPTNPKNILAGWQQDRWSNGGSCGLLAGLSRNGAAGFKTVVPGRVSKCEGGPWTRDTDPWLDFSSKGVAYFMHLAIEPDLPS